MKRFLLPSLVMTTVAFQNCSNKAFVSIDPKEKLAKLENGEIFGPQSATGVGSLPTAPNNTGSGNLPVGQVGSGSGELPVGQPGSSSGSLPVGEPGASNGILPVGQGYPGNAELGAQCGTGTVPPNVGNAIPSLHICSDNLSAQNGNVATAESLTVDIKNPDGSKACSFTDTGLRNIILNSKQIPMDLVSSQCPTLKVGTTYQINVRDSKRSASTTLVDKAKFKAQKLENGWAFNVASLPLVVDFNKGTKASITDEDCDNSHSPLVIRFESQSLEKLMCGQEKLKLSKPSEGIMFDILGDKATPAPHTPKKISWASTETFYILALPKSGKIGGIDELFGDATMGPDGKMAENGYAALAKYDGKSVDGKSSAGAADGYITKDDPIFKELRLWKDANFDGVAQSGELKTLAQMKVAVIDLNFDPNYRELDIYGNEIKFKSVIQTEDENLHTMFDLWFVLADK